MVTVRIVSHNSSCSSVAFLTFCWWFWWFLGLVLCSVAIEDIHHNLIYFKFCLNPFPVSRPGCGLGLTGGACFSFLCLPVGFSQQPGTGPRGAVSAAYPLPGKCRPGGQGPGRAAKFSSPLRAGAGAHGCCCEGAP